MRLMALSALVLITACSHASAPASDAAPGEWHAFTGNWIATGTRSTIPLGASREASIADLEGTMLLSGDARPARGFRGEAIVFNDTGANAEGRAVWTDSDGSQVFSEIHGTGIAAGKKIEGRFLGGTGRFAGATGTFTFTWQFVIDTDDGRIQGQTTDLSGRIRAGGTP
ncbi:MAG: hypothetical protein JO199_10985 [Candidatus Eremiobacteraeota bacterium]|nr:hypothetical protein [Candidatus Eremiobacteraeota bacterium]